MTISQYFKNIFMSSVIVLSVFLVAAVGYAAPPEDALQIQNRMQAFIDYVDSPLYQSLATWDEHVVLVYNKTQGRNPKILEAEMLRSLHNSIGLPRSAVISFALRGKNNKPTWGQIRSFINKVRRTDFIPDAVTQREAARLKQVPDKVLKELLDKELRQLKNSASSTPLAASASTQAPLSTVDYSIYYGYLHAHSELSDGTGSPDDAYTAARNAGLNFFALTDHGELLAIWPWEHKWEALVAAANNANNENNTNDEEDTFVALWGFEWSNPFLGHINVMNSEDYTHALSTFSLTAIYDWIAGRPQSFARFNHPGEYDGLGLEFLHFLPYAPVREQMVGIETWNGDQSFDVFFYAGGYSSSFSYLDEANRRLWYLGALGGQDNHQADWGSKKPFRTAVLSNSFTREGIIDAYKNRRFYATEDKELELYYWTEHFSTEYPMGSRISGFIPNRTFYVKACDTNEDFAAVSFYRNGSLLQNRSISNGFGCVTVDFTDFNIFPSYYYVVVQQDDGDEAISSAIWFGL